MSWKGTMIPVELLAVVVLIAAAALCLVGSVPHVRAGTTPADTAT
jgi:hypothetical protein